MEFKNRYVLYNLQLFDGKTTDLKKNKTVLVEGTKIRAVEDGTARRENGNIRAIDLHGYTLMPGLIDLHVHITKPFMDRVTARAFFAISDQIERNARVCIEAGITTVRDVGGFPGQLSRLRTAINTGDLPGPRIVMCNSALTTPGGSPDWVPSFNPLIRSFLGGQYALRVATPSQARGQVEEMIRLGATWIKLYCQHHSVLLGGGTLSVFDQETFHAIMETAHRNHRKVCCHITWLRDLSYALSMGVDTFEHCPLEKISGETAADFAARSMALIPTLTCLDLGNAALWSMLETTVSEQGRHYLEPEPLRQVKNFISRYRIRPYPPEETAYRREPYFDLSLFKRCFPQVRENVGRILHSGGRVGVGTDSGGMPTALFGVFYHEELKRLVSCGLTPVQALMAATSGNASILGLDDTIGSITAGRVADLIAVEGNPLHNLNALKHVRMVIKEGRFMTGEPEEKAQTVVTKWRRFR
ncbi:MAG: amidohydrolase family protein [Desulfomonilia bacterium]|nr:amidohydrolase family protein [Desulfomonilia bacterium]